MGPDPSESFRELRPVCIKLSREPTPQSIRNLDSKLASVNPVHLSQLVEYVLFPLKLALQSPNATCEIQELCVRCIETLFSRAHVYQSGTFEEMFNYLCMLVSSREGGPGQIADKPEELKLAVVSCLSRLIQSTSLVIKAAFFSPRCLPILGHSVSILLALSENEKAKNLKLSALGCLSNLACCAGENIVCRPRSVGSLEQEEDREALENAVKDSVALTFASFIPGISISLCRVITGDSKQGHAVIVQAIDLWGDILSLVMNDKHMPSKPSDSEDVISQLTSLVTEAQSTGVQARGVQENKEADISDSNPEKLEKLPSLKVNRTVKWFCDTSSKLRILIERLSTISAYPNWKVRLSLAKFCDKLLTDCMDSLQSCVSTVVDLLVGLSEDDYSQVASLSKTVLQKLSGRLGSGKQLCYPNTDWNANASAGPNASPGWWEGGGGLWVAITTKNV